MTLVLCAVALALIYGTIIWHAAKGQELPRWFYLLSLSGIIALIIGVGAQQGIIAALLFALGCAVPITGWALALLSD
jgi:hypothetical protein